MGISKGVKRPKTPHGGTMRELEMHAPTVEEAFAYREWGDGFGETRLDSTR